MFRPWEQMLTAAVKGAERLPEPLASLVTAAACKAHRWSGDLPALTSASAARNALPEVCHTDLGARLGNETMEFAARSAIGASALAVLVVGSKVHQLLDRHTDPEFLRQIPMSAAQVVRPGPHHRRGLPGLVVRALCAGSIVARCRRPELRARREPVKP